MEESSEQTQLGPAPHGCVRFGNWLDEGHGGSSTNRRPGSVAEDGGAFVDPLPERGRAAELGVVG